MGGRTLALSAALIVLYLRECRRMNEAIPLEAEQACRLRAEADIPGRTKLLVSDRIVTPLVFGIVNPKIILPAFLTADGSGRLKFVLAHEAVHVRRGDNLWKIVMMVAVCIHWFNPLVWIMYVLFTRDMELSCDEKVLFPLRQRERRENKPEPWSVWRRNSIGLRFSPRDSGKAPLKKGSRQL